MILQPYQLVVLPFLDGVHAFVIFPFLPIIQIMIVTKVECMSSALNKKTPSLYRKNYEINPPGPQTPCNENIIHKSFKLEHQYSDLIIQRKQTRTKVNIS